MKGPCVCCGQPATRYFDDRLHCNTCLDIHVQSLDTVCKCNFEEAKGEEDFCVKGA